MAKAKGGLGRGLGALLPEYEEIVETHNGRDGIVELELDKIFPNPDQPRKTFDEDKLTDLAESITEHGVLQPIIVTPRNDKYMIIAGERRFRASGRAGLKTIPALVRELDDEKIMELALIENVQRDDLSPIEEARAYDVLQTKFGYTQERLAKRMGKSRSAIANSTRLLALPEDVQQMVQDGKLTVGHVRPLLSINVPEWQSAFAQEVYQSNLSVREVEKMVKKAVDEGHVTWETEEVLFQAPQKYKKLPSELRTLQDQLAERLSTKVNIKKNRDGSGKLVIEYYSEEDLTRIFDALKGDFY
ncbi:MAG: ParB/RepB/Spo0J family partition protein [Peptococcaceae bacterium]|nr:ParB/RepB/Spo0J family partition protein [Peptococcaceae bacterium]